MNGDQVFDFWMEISSQKIETMNYVFTDILAGFTFNSRVLRLQAIVLLKHDVSTRKLGPSSGIRPSFLNRPIYTFPLICLGVATHRSKLFWKKKCYKLFLELSSCLCGFAVKLCWNRVYCYVHVLAEVGFCVQFLVKFATFPQPYWTKSHQILLKCKNPRSWFIDPSFLVIRPDVKRLLNLSFPVMLSPLNYHCFPIMYVVSGGVCMLCYCQLV